jgi:hypothetical protein
MTTATEYITPGSAQHSEIGATYSRLATLLDDSDSMDWEVVLSINYLQGALQALLDLLTLGVSVPSRGVNGWMSDAEDWFEAFDPEDDDEEED